MAYYDDSEEKARACKAKIFARHSKAAIAGTHLPSLKELYQLIPFCGNDIKVDIQMYSERLSRRIKWESAGVDLARKYLSELTVDCDAELCVATGNALNELRAEKPSIRGLFCEANERYQLYAACLGDAKSMLNVAGTLCRLAESLHPRSDEISTYASGAVGWLLLATEFVNPFGLRRNDARQAACECGAKFLKKANPEVSERLSDKDATIEAHIEVQATPQNGPSAPKDLTVVVLQRVGNTDISAGSTLRREFKEIEAKALPLIAIPNLDLIGNTLLTEFPHAADVTKAMLGGLYGKQHVTMRPTVLFGPPGCGKTSYAERFLDLLEVPNETYPCGGVADSTIGGTARRWHSGEPSLPVAMIRRHATASPGILLDEMEKASTSKQNGSMFDVLLGFFEAQSARRWVDPYIQSPVDLSNVVWIATANTLKGIPGVLLDRCRAIRFPEPRPSDMVAISYQMLKRVFERRGLSSRWASPFTVEEMEAMSRLWQGSSLRTLERLVEAVVASREHGMTRH
ncbi:AAA family ATPase [Dongia sp.]|uniref:AAA family ATPase n=1 Tax=Dongia sp. TaxID=1977262 RepID=UPI0035B051FC